MQEQERWLSVWELHPLCQQEARSASGLTSNKEIRKMQHFLRSTSMTLKKNFKTPQAFDQTWKEKVGIALAFDIKTDGYYPKFSKAITDIRPIIDRIANASIERFINSTD